ncbi:MAG: hypothetical protein M3Q30_23195 [Actinomycetota bacterium]|nr:hypothetical protein [Actinomycetota bacterium]
MLEPGRSTPDYTRGNGCAFVNGPDNRTNPLEHVIVAKIEDSRERSDYPVAQVLSKAPGGDLGQAMASFCMGGVRFEARVDG